MNILCELFDFNSIVPNGYNSLKDKIGLVNDFSFTVRTIGDGTPNIDELSVGKRVPAGVSAIAKEFPIRTIDDTGQINEYIMNILVW